MTEQSKNPHDLSAIADEHSRRRTILSTIAGRYLNLPRDRELEWEFSLLLDGIHTLRGNTGTSYAESGRYGEGRLLALTGASGVGKSRALALRMEAERERHPDIDMISVIAPSPCTLRVLGMTILSKLGYPVQRRLRENEAWDQVRNVLAPRNISILHIDEVQHLLQSKSDLEIQKVRDTLKGLMQSSRPISIVLSGLPETLDLLQADPQLQRRARFVHFNTLEKQDVEPIKAFLKIMVTQVAGLSLTPPDIDDLTSRVLMAGEGRLGIVCEIIHDAIDDALRRSSRTVTLSNFQRVYQARTGCRAYESPFQPGTKWALGLNDPR